MNNCYCHWGNIFLKWCQQGNSWGNLYWSGALSRVWGGVKQSSCCVAPSFNHTLLKRNLKEKFNNLIALKSQFVTLLKVLIKTKYSQEVMLLRVLGRSVIFFSFIPGKTTVQLLSCQMLHYLSCVYEKIVYISFFFSPRHLQTEYIITGERLCWQAHLSEHLSEVPWSKAHYLIMYLPVSLLKAKQNKCVPLSDKRLTKAAWVRYWSGSDLKDSEPFCQIAVETAFSKQR